MKNNHQWTIGTLSKKSGLHTRTLRFYESVGLLAKPERTPSGYRLYDPSIIEQIEFIQKGQSLGLTLREIREILELGESGSCPCGHVKRTLQAKLKELNQKIKDLSYLNQRIRRVLRSGKASKKSGRQGAALCPTIAKVKNNRKKP